MKFYLLVVLSPEQAAADDEAVRQTVRAQLAPFGQAHCEPQDLPHRWDYSWCCDKSWLQEQGIDLALYPQASTAHELLLVPTAGLSLGAIPAALLTPDGQWHESAATLQRDDPHWPARVLQLLSRYPKHSAALVYAHR